MSEITKNISDAELNSLSATPSPLTSCWMKLRRKSMLSLISQSNLSLLTILF